MLLQRAKTQSERYIASRRQQEESINKLATKLKQENHERAFAAWEVKGQTVDKKNFYKQKMSQLRETAQKQIEQRRNKLNELLKQENEQFKKEIEGMQETSEQVRERMLQRVKELKTQKELERQKYSTQQYERRFEEEADELRKIDFDFKELKTSHERNMQTMEKQKAMIDNYNEEMIYAELYKRDIRKKEKQEKEILEEQRKKVNERNQILSLQKGQLEEKSQQEKIRENLEKQMLNEEWRKEEERLKKQNEEQFQINRKMNKNMIAVNFEEKFVKEEDKKLEKLKDKNWISEVVSKEKALEKLDYEIREKQKRETRDFLHNFKNRANELNNDEHELNKLIQEEDDKQWKKRMDVWQKEEEQRVKLMYEVYESRSKALDNRKAVTETEKQDKDKEKQKLNEELENFIREEEKTREELWKRNKEHQMNIINQREVKIDQEKLKEVQKKKEIEEEKLREIEYQKKIEAKKLKGKELLDELRKMRPF